MTDKIETVIDTGGDGDYSGMDSAHSDTFGAVSSNLVGNDEDVDITLKCTDGNPDPISEGLMLSYTADATRNLSFVVAPAYKHPGYYPSSGNVYRMELTNNGLLLSANYTTLEGIAFQHSVTLTYKWAMYINAVTGCIIRRCVGTMGSGSYINPGAIGTWALGTGKTARIESCIIYDYTNSGADAFIVDGGDGGGSVEFFNNTVANVDTGFTRIAGKTPTTLTNNIAWSCVTPYSGSWAAATYNAFSSGADPGTNGIDLSSYSASQLFVNAAGGDYHLRPVGSNPLLTVGANLYASGVTVDIDGQPRPSSGAWDIGADRATRTTGDLLLAGNLARIYVVAGHIERIYELAGHVVR